MDSFPPPSFFLHTCLLFVILYLSTYSSFPYSFISPLPLHWTPPLHETLPLHQTLLPILILPVRLSLTALHSRLIHLCIFFLPIPLVNEFHNFSIESMDFPLFVSAINSFEPFIPQLLLCYPFRISWFSSFNWTIQKKSNRRSRPIFLLHNFSTQHTQDLKP